MIALRLPKRGRLTDGNTIEYAQNLVYRLWDPGGRLRLDDSGKQANFRVIDLDASDFRELKMLFQYIDGTGYFNEHQLELIRSQNLPMLKSYPRPNGEVGSPR